MDARAVQGIVAIFEVEGGAVRLDRPVITDGGAGPQWMCA
jgi:hypothetical protein